VGATRAVKSILKEHAQRMQDLNGVWLPVGKDSAAVPQPTLVSTSYARNQPKKRLHSVKTELLYARIREIPRKVLLKEFCKRCDAMQRTFLVPKYLRDDGCPELWFAAWQDASKWRERIRHLRQNAWRP
jgi:hypothetical protein